MSVDWEAVRGEFPALRNWTYLNTATFGQLPRRATEAVATHFAHRDEMACGDFLSWYDDMDRVRAKVARLIHCQAGRHRLHCECIHGARNSVGWLGLAPGRPHSDAGA